MQAISSFRSINLLRVWRMLNAFLLWLGLILPWWQLDEHEAANAFIVILHALATYTEQGTFFGFLVGIGLALMVWYASLEWIAALSENQFFPGATKFRFIGLGLVTLILIWVLNFNQASTGFFSTLPLYGYWLFGVALLSNLITEFTSSGTRSRNK